MSWEQVSNIKKACPCECGTYSIITEMDDWNRTRSNWEMNCARCAVEYVLFEQQAYDSGIPYAAKRWVRASSYSQYRQLNAEAEELAQRAAGLAKERYLDRWLAFFDGKPKKVIWQILTDDGSRYPALGTFYRHVRGEGTEAYLDRWFRNNTATALSLLAVTDAEIENAMRTAKAKSDEARSLL